MYIIISTIQKRKLKRKLTLRARDTMRLEPDSLLLLRMVVLLSLLLLMVVLEVVVLVT